MINNTKMPRDINESSKTFAGLLNQGQAQDYAFYRHIRARFLQQSALYLGANLNDSRVLSLCFSNNAFDIPQTGK